MRARRGPGWCQMDPREEVGNAERRLEAGRGVGHGPRRTHTHVAAAIAESATLSRLRPRVRASSARSNSSAGADGNRSRRHSVLTGMTPRELITEYLTAARGGDWATAYGYFADDMHI